MWPFLPGLLDCYLQHWGVEPASIKSKINPPITMKHNIVTLRRTDHLGTIEACRHCGCSPEEAPTKECNPGIATHVHRDGQEAWSIYKLPADYTLNIVTDTTGLVPGGNCYDPRLEKAACYMTYDHHTRANGPAAMALEFLRHAFWLEGVIIGPPHACKAGTSQEMAANGYLGIYRKP